MLNVGGGVVADSTAAAEYEEALWKARFAGPFALALGLTWATDAHVAVALLTVVALHLVLGTFEILYLKRTDALE